MSINLWYSSVQEAEANFPSLEGGSGFRLTSNDKKEVEVTVSIQIPEETEVSSWLSRRDTCSGRSHCHAMRTLKRPSGDVYQVRRLRPPANRLHCLARCERTLLEVGPPAPPTQAFRRLQPPEWPRARTTQLSHAWILTQKLYKVIHFNFIFEAAKCSSNYFYF